MKFYMRPVKEHECNEKLDGNCSVCLAHALNPSNTFSNDGVPFVIKFWMIFTVGMLTAGLLTSKVYLP